jgi:N-acetylated-alpha-linked acidic dipeptidase
LAKTAGRAILRFANADYLPLAPTNFAETLSTYVRDLTRLNGEARDTIVERNRRIKDGTYARAADPKKTTIAPKAEAPAPTLNFMPLQNALTRLQQSARDYDAAAHDASARLRSREVQQALDTELGRLEMTMLDERGLPRRPWYEHQIYAPGFYTGYGAKTLPGVREAIEQHRWDEAVEQMAIAAAAIERMAAQLDRATAVLRK